jgi:hypothetical protein
MNRALLAIAGILTLLLIVGSVLTVHLYKKTVELSGALDLVVVSNEQLKQQVSLQKDSCKISETITEGLKAENEALKVAFDSMLVELDAIPVVIKKVGVLPSEQGKCNADDDSLSPELVGLLQQSYCSAGGVSSDCTTSKSDKGLPSK